jgi:hypothetical protein
MVGVVWMSRDVLQGKNHILGTLIRPTRDDKRRVTSERPQNPIVFISMTT